MNNIDLILKKVKKVWEAHPELRLGQMLCNVANYGALYYSTNEEIIKLLEQFYKIDTSDVEKETETTKAPTESTAVIADNTFLISIIIFLSNLIIFEYIFHILLSNNINI